MIIDISWPISPTMTSYKNNKPVIFTRLKDFASDGVRDANIQLNTHAGTHIDAPAHFLATGKTIDQVPLESLIGNAVVIDLTNVQEAITDLDLQKHVFASSDIILLKTKNSALSTQATFDFKFVSLAPSGATLLATRGVKAVGIDYLGIERNQPNHETHTILLKKEIPIIEGLRLDQAEPGRYQFYCLPIAIMGLEAAPARAILIKN
jgi:arylformamidase